MSHPVNSVPCNALGKRVETVRMVENVLRIVFDDATEIALADRGQDCCESRYMTCDDDLSSFTGELLVGIDVGDAPQPDAGGEVHEVQFLNVRFSSGSVLVCQTHNEHNGYYGGFSVSCEEVAS